MQKPAAAGRPARVDQRRNGEQILQAAAALLATDPGASMQAIADAAGLTRLTVYRHFPNRAALEEALLAAIDARAEAIIETLPGWDDGTDTLRALIHALADLIRRYPVITTWHRVEVGARRSPVDVKLSDVLRRGQLAGVLRRDLHPDVLNGTLFAMITAQARLRPDATSAQWATGVGDLLLHGLAVTPVRTTHPSSSGRTRR